MDDETRQWIERVQKSGASPTAQSMGIYEKLVSEEGLFDKAFFGHRTTRKEKKRLDRLWKLSKKLGGMNEEGSTQTDIFGRIHWAGEHQRPLEDGDSSSERKE